VHYALVKNLMRTSKRGFCLSAFTMHRHHHLTFAAFLMFIMIEMASAVVIFVKSADDRFNRDRKFDCGEGEESEVAQMFNLDPKETVKFSARLKINRRAYH